MDHRASLVARHSLLAARELPFGESMVFHVKHSVAPAPAPAPVSTLPFDIRDGIDHAYVQARREWKARVLIAPAWISPSAGTARSVSVPPTAAADAPA